VDTLYGEIEYLVDHLVGNDVDTLHEERIHLVGFSFIRVIDYSIQVLYSYRPDYIYMCKQLMAIEIPKNRLIIYDSMKKL